MPRYFFHLRDGATLLPNDGEGQEFASLKAARREAIESARQILSEAALSGLAGSLNHQLEVTDENGRTILTVQVGRATGTETQT